MKKILLCILFSVIIFFLVKGWWSSQFESASSDKTTKVFIIAKGASVSEIAGKLKEENLIKSESAFKIY